MGSKSNKKRYTREISWLLASRYTHTTFLQPSYDTRMFGYRKLLEFQHDEKILIDEIWIYFFTLASVYLHTYTIDFHTYIHSRKQSMWYFTVTDNTDGVKRG